MISYLVYSTACMALLLLFYHIVLEQEKMHPVNRGYLVFSLVFSLSIPLIPVGMADSVIPWFQARQISEIQPLYYLSRGEWLETGPEGMLPGSETSGHVTAFIESNCFPGLHGCRIYPFCAPAPNRSYDSTEGRPESKKTF